ncbi:MAG TPA: methyltransferase domain-containing protein [Gaiellaceae bacterium]|nr:methyltransferase domain-containing protein [Gaiellaceae bacterium]
MNADIEDVRRRRDEVVARHGAWTAHNVRLADGVYTIGPEPSGDEVKLRRVTQLALDAFGGSLHGVRVLDLACLEGMYALELARRGAEVVAVEGREANLAKARFAADVLGLDVDFRLEDVRHVDRERHGDFDLVLALGILYHLDAPDLLALVENLGELCRRALIVDSAVARAATETIAHDGRAYRAERLVEHEPGSTAEQRLQAVWSSLDNLTAVALTRPSLETLLAANGFTSVLECHVPAEPAKEVNRVTLLALKGEPAGTLVSATPAADPAAVPERPPLGRRLEGGAAWRLGGRLLPPAVRARLRRALGAETRRH